MEIQESKVKCIFLSEFHPVAGPQITCQIPDDYITKEVFDALSVYIIPKHQLQGTIMTINALGHKIVGYPIQIDSPKYDRNAFYFNLCFVCDSGTKTVQYEPVVKKIAEYLVAMETESNFLSQESSKYDLPQIFDKILHDINRHKTCTVIEGIATWHLKVVDQGFDPPPVHDHDVPTFTCDHLMYLSDQWDLTTQQILPFVDGNSHVLKIAAEADVDRNLVKSSIQNMIYYGIMNLVPIFQYSNVYTVMPKMQVLACDKELQEKCIREVAISKACLPAFKNIFKIYCSMTYGTTVKDLCLRFNPQEIGIDEKSLIRFGLLEGIIRRIHRYPICVGDQKTMLHRYMKGDKCADEICCETGLSYLQLEEKINSDPDVLVIYK